MTVRKVNMERWREAQQWERGHWESAEIRHGWRRITPLVRPIFRLVGSDKGAGNDFNHWWFEKFDGYACLPNEIGDYIELGCGPYTNTRLIVKGRKVDRIVCSDPLIETYVNFKGRWLADSHRRGSITIDNHPLEEIPFAPAAFDVVVVINVLDHVFDFDACMRKAVDLVRPRGYFVLGQELTSEEEHTFEDVGHPIWVTEAEIDPHLESFRTVLRKDLPRGEGRNPAHHYGTMIYVGQKAE